MTAPVRAACNGRPTVAMRVSRTSATASPPIPGASQSAQAAEVEPRHFGIKRPRRRAFEEPRKTAGTLSDLLESIEDW